MWIFDGVITDEDNSATNTATMEQSQTSEDNSLIISDSQDNTVITNISSSDIPDSAISFFDETTEATQTENIWTSLFWNKIVSEQESVQSAEEWDVVFSQEEAVDNTSLVNLFWTSEQSDIITQATTSTVVWNPNEILANAISSLEIFLAWHEDSIADKMESIEAKQVQINNLKQEIKALNEEAKVVAEEKMKVEKMIELFKSQKV